ncbi:MAG: ParM/StbA family protein [Candidatus Methanofastidiosum sp.]|nr:ParM/StbA family protein [Methanofastidiosum sp.]
MKVLGLDIGFGHTKCYSEGIKFKFPTQLAYPPDDPNMEVERVNVAGREYVVGRDTKYVSSYRIEIPTVIELVQHAPVFLKYVLDKFGKFDIIVTGLPPNAKAYVPALVNNLKIVDAEIIVLPQGIGILYDVASTKDIGDDAVIIDMGYNTVDCVVTEKHDDVWKKKRGITLENFGVMKAVEIMREILPERIGVLKNWSASRLLEIFEKGEVSIDGERIDLVPFKNESILRYTEILNSKIKQELKDSFKDISTIVVAGGGAYYVDKKYFGRNVIIPDEPEFSQARGYYVAGLQSNLG